MASDIAEAIRAAEFDEYDLDAGTNSFCGTFALALKKSFPEIELGLIVFNDEKGQPLIAKDGQYVWRHAVGVADDRLFDIEGEVLLEHLIDNYCWNNPKGKGGSLVRVTEDEFLAHVDDTKGSFNPTYYRKWMKAILRGRNAEIDRAEAISPAPKL
ncbi:hypothetical protein [Mesorhizobium sp. SP-1A]|uniref:hypothetical protein n=1 Tax=Mesorhizobium sp. SP-1A TaxID=3077840 RepID=UPI0028F6C81A|nr:hypothetical protein [Mesorhizobium sp. SP-1A]